MTDRKYVLFLFFIPASLFATEMDSWSDSLCSCQFSCSLTWMTPKSFPKWKKNKEKILRYYPAPSNLHARKRLLVFEDKAHWRISKIFIILTWWYILLIHHHLLMAVTIWSPPTQVPCISLRHLFSFLLQTWHLEDHYMTYIGSFYKVLSCLDPVLS